MLFPMFRNVLDLMFFFDLLRFLWFVCNSLMAYPVKMFLSTRGQACLEK